MTYRPGNTKRPGDTTDEQPAKITLRPDKSSEHVASGGHDRLLVVGCLFAVAFVAIAVRLIDVAVLRPSHEPSPSAERTDAPLKTGRADIIDRNGVLLATSLTVPSLFADPKLVRDPNQVARKLVSVLGDLNPAEISAKLSSARRFVWLKRNLTPSQQYDVNRLGIPGLSFQMEERRVYPQGRLSAHIVGYAGHDAIGLAGIEKKFDDLLRAGTDPLRLSVDIRIQHMVKQELAAQIATFSGVGGAAVVLDARTAEIVSMVSLPDFEPNLFSTADDDARFNRASLGVYEMGSTFKIFNTAMALDAGTATMSSGYDATKPIRVARFTINDYHAKRRWLSVPEIFMYSSNIGSVKMALDVGTKRQRAFMGKLGFLKPVAVELPEKGTPMTPSPWRQINTMTISFGHGLAVSPLHLANAVASIVNGGIKRPITLLARGDKDRITLPKGKRVISKRTSRAMRQLLRLVVEHGTGRKAAAEGYLVGGKTGTAEKSGGRGRYNRKSLLSSFVATFPSNDPRYVVLVMVDEPKGTKESHGYATGGWVAAPAVKRIVSRAAPLLGIHPVDEMSPEIRRDLKIRLPDAKGGKRLASF